MKVLAIVSAVIVLGLSQRAHAQQHVIGSGGTTSANLGYYSPYPGALYSPFRQATPVPLSAYSMGNFNRVGGNPQIYNNGSTITRVPGNLGMSQHYGSGGLNSHGMRRR